MADILFTAIENMNSPRCWGRFLDAGTGVHSLKWIQQLQTSEWVAITADNNMKNQITNDKDIKLRWQENRRSICTYLQILTSQLPIFLQLGLEVSDLSTYFSMQSKRQTDRWKLDGWIVLQQVRDQTFYHSYLSQFTILLLANLMLLTVFISTSMKVTHFSLLQSRHLRHYTGGLSDWICWWILSLLPRCHREQVRFRIWISLADAIINYYPVSNSYSLNCPGHKSYLLQDEEPLETGRAHIRCWHESYPRQCPWECKHCHWGQKTEGQLHSAFWKQAIQVTDNIHFLNHQTLSF